MTETMTYHPANDEMNETVERIEALLAMDRPKAVSSIARALCKAASMLLGYEPPMTPTQALVIQVFARALLERGERM
jgi:hypothetical protein